MSVENSSWAIERDYPHPPERVFNAWADPSIKVRWFDLSGNNNPDYHGDFRVGGTESFRTPAGASRAARRLARRWSRDAQIQPTAAPATAAPGSSKSTARSRRFGLRIAAMVTPIRKPATRCKITFVCSAEAGDVIWITCG